MESVLQIGDFFFLMEFMEVIWLIKVCLVCLVLAFIVLVERSYAAYSIRHKST